MQGAALAEAERQAVQAKIARYSGLSEAYVEQTNLRINIFQFVKELLRSQKRTVGRLDTRFTGVDRNAVGENSEFDPSYTNVQGPYTAAFNDYVRGELAFESDLPYEILTGRVHPWSYKEHENRFVDVAETLRSAMSMNPFLKIYIANGYFDLATPYRATEYTINHLSLDPSLQPNIRMAYFEAGHMMYIHQPSLMHLRQDLLTFIQDSIPPA
jgi:carboxypeptidase C (cathepsin A)